MISSWNQSKQKSNYHFDNFKNDTQVDKVIKLGKILADYTEDVVRAVKTAKPATPRPITVPPVKETLRACFKLVRAA